MPHPNAPAPRATGLLKNVAHIWRVGKLVLPHLGGSFFSSLSAAANLSDSTGAGRVAIHREVFSCRS